MSFKRYKMFVRAPARDDLDLAVGQTTATHADTGSLANSGTVKQLTKTYPPRRLNRST